MKTIHKPYSLFLILLAAVVLFSSIIVLLLSDQSSQASWKSFSSQKFGLSFNYPPNWTVYETPSEIGITQPGSKYAFTITIIGDTPNIDRYLEGLEKNTFFQVDSDSQIKIGHLKTLALTDTAPTHTQYMLYAPLEKNVYDVVFLSDNPERTSLITRILSTFKFTNKYGK